MTARAYVDHEPFRRYSNLYVMLDDNTALDGTGTFYTIQDGVGLPEGFTPIRLPYSTLEAIRDAINVALGVQPEPYSRKDFEKEQERVDRLTSTLISLALDRMDEAVS